ncbi:MAG: hypothetical protein GY839_17020 [candidate division Zixibacteria bacterium]|nr:hypothetical protein [candidate division Zixibacteria bacterium]
MTDKKDARCYRCGKRLKNGGDNYRLECTIVADFDGYIDISDTPKGLEELVANIELSGLTEEELQEQVYYRLKRRLCHLCRDEIVKYMKGLNQDG